jgi:hypothetical protein
MERIASGELAVVEGKLEKEEGGKERSLGTVQDWERGIANPIHRINHAKISSLDRSAPFEKDNSLDKTGGVGQAHVVPAYIYGYWEERDVKGGEGEEGNIRDENAMDEAGIVENIVENIVEKQRLLQRSEHIPVELTTTLATAR